MNWNVPGPLQRNALLLPCSPTTVVPPSEIPAGIESLAPGISLKPKSLRPVASDQTNGAEGVLPTLTEPAAYRPSAERAVAELAVLPGRTPKM